MTHEERVVQRETVDADGVARPVVARDRATTVTSERVAYRRSGTELARRIIVFLFGLIQGLIVLRIVLLLLNAREGNDIVAFVLNLSQVFVAPFNGILGRDELASSGSVLDIAAIVALVGWTILELIIIALLNIFRREP
jgi:hypothetical protein